MKNVGGERVEVATLVGPNGNAHVYAPSPADAKSARRRQTGVRQRPRFRGLDRAAGQSVRHQGADHRRDQRHQAARARGRRGHDHDHGPADPHAWQSVANAKIYVANIRDALIAADPAGKAVYEANATAYLAKLDALEREVRDVVARIPADRRRVITSHDAFGYFQRRLWRRLHRAAGRVDRSRRHRPATWPRIITQIKKQKIPAVFLENVTDPRLVQQIARETGAKIGGTLYSDALTDAKGDATTYIDLIRHNLNSSPRRWRAEARQSRYPSDRRPHPFGTRRIQRRSSG